MSMRKLPLYREHAPPPPAYVPPATAPAPAAGSRPAGASPFDALAALYRDLDREIAALAPRCDARGLCCDFDRVDHVLYASTLEVAYVKANLPREQWARETGNVCPLLTPEGRCGAREHRMLGCRTYFCQPGFAPYAAELYERYYARIKAIAREHDLEWRYAPALRQFRE